MSTGQNIAFRIRAELVCCGIYDEVNVCKTMTFDEAMASSRWHDLCYWGEAAAQLAEGHCPGHETAPNICECLCEGCKHNCAAHHESPNVVPGDGLLCACGNPAQWTDHPTDPGWIHSPGSDTPCTEARPVCPFCHTAHPLTPGPVPPSPAETQTAKERDMLGRETDRLRRDWLSMRDQHDAAEGRNRMLKDELTEARTALLNFRSGLRVVKQAIEELPKTCRYHGGRTAPDGPGWMRESCCDTGLPAHRRKLAETALAELLNEEVDI